MTKRCNLLSQIHIAKKDLGMDDDMYRAALVNATMVICKRTSVVQRPGLSSSGEMNKAQRQQVLDHFKSLGWKNSRPATRKGKQYTKATSRKMIVLWKGLYKAGKVANQTNAAFEQWVANESGKQNPDWLTAEEANTLIEQLKAWEKRA